MHRYGTKLLGVSALALGIAIVTATQGYASTAASPRAARTQVIKAMEVNSQYVFSPARATIKLGWSVRWVNRTDAPHTVTFYRAGMLDKALAQGKTVTFTPRAAGVYRYHCTYHAGMVATLVVKK